jgi:hypothetical protein
MELLPCGATLFLALITVLYKATEDDWPIVVPLGYVPLQVVCIGVTGYARDMTDAVVWYAINGMVCLMVVVLSAIWLRRWWMRS